jgi:hypothetical protein
MALDRDHVEWDKLSVKRQLLHVFPYKQNVDLKINCICVKGQLDREEIRGNEKGERRGF